MASHQLYATELSKAAEFLNSGDLKQVHDHLESALGHLNALPVLTEDESSKHEQHESSLEADNIKAETSTYKADSTDNAGASAAIAKSKSPASPSVPKYTGKIGRSSHTSPYNPSTPVIPNSQVAYKPRGQANAEWILCRVLRVVTDVKFEIQDPEPDDSNPNGAIFKATSKEIILIPLNTRSKPLKPYKPRMKVLAKYPETTVFYPAEVVECSRETCRLIFEGEEEEDKITSVERHFVLPAA